MSVTSSPLTGFEVFSDHLLGWWRCDATTHEEAAVSFAHGGCEGEIVASLRVRVASYGDTERWVSVVKRTDETWEVAK